eukprot:749511-Hanusia_phi.AAC.1
MASKETTEVSDDLSASQEPGFWRRAIPYSNEFGPVTSFSFPQGFIKFASTLRPGITAAVQVTAARFSMLPILLDRVTLRPRRQPCSDGDAADRTGVTG